MKDLKHKEVPIPMLLVAMEAGEVGWLTKVRYLTLGAMRAQGETGLVAQGWGVCLRINPAACLQGHLCLVTLPAPSVLESRLGSSLSSRHAPAGEPAPAAARTPALRQAGQTESCPVPRPARTAASGCQHHLTCWLLRAASRRERKREEANSRQVRGRRTVDWPWPFPCTSGLRACFMWHLHCLTFTSCKIAIS